MSHVCCWVSQRARLKWDEKEKFMISNHDIRINFSFISFHLLSSVFLLCKIKRARDKMKINCTHIDENLFNFFFCNCFDFKFIVHNFSLSDNYFLSFRRFLNIPESLMCFFLLHKSTILISFSVDIFIDLSRFYWNPMVYIIIGMHHTIIRFVIKKIIIHQLISSSFAWKMFARTSSKKKKDCCDQEEKL